MGKMIDWFKAHPLAGGLVVFGVGLILVLALFGGSSNSGESTVVTADQSDVGANSALVAAQLNAGVQIQTAQINANVQQAAIAAGVAVNKDNNATQITGLNIQADTTTKIATLQAANDAAAIQAAKDINGAQMSTAQQVAVIQAGADTTIAGIQKQMNDTNAAAAVTMSNNAMATNLAYFAMNTDLTKYGTDANLAAYKYGQDTSLAGYKYGQDAALAATKYTADTGLAASKAALDAGLAAHLADTTASYNLAASKNAQDYYATLNRQSLQYQLGQSAIGVSSAVTQATGMPYYLPVAQVA
jgi:hypothetical protein